MNRPDVAIVEIREARVVDWYYFQPRLAVSLESVSPLKCTVDELPTRLPERMIRETAGTTTPRGVEKQDPPRKGAAPFRKFFR